MEENEFYLPLAEDLFIAAQANFLGVSFETWKKNNWNDTTKVPPIYIKIAKMCFESQRDILDKIFK